MSDWAARYDQLHAEAIDRLRVADYFFIATALDVEEHGQQVEMSIGVLGAGREHFEAFKGSLAQSLALNEGLLPDDYVEAIAELDGARDFYLSSGRKWRLRMIAVCAANAVLAVFTLVRLAVWG